MAQKRKLERLKDMPSMASTSNNIVMEVKQIDTPILQSILSRAYNSCPQARQAIDVEYERVKRAGIAQDTLASGNKTAWNKGNEAPWNLYDSDSAVTQVEPSYKLQKLAKKVSTPKVKTKLRAEIDISKESCGSGYKYNTPTAIAKRVLKEARSQGLPVYCIKCKKQEPTGLPKHWPVPNGGDGVVCPDCRSTRWKKPTSEGEPSGLDIHRKGSNTTVLALD